MILNIKLDTPSSGLLVEQFLVTVHNHLHLVVIDNFVYQSDASIADTMTVG